MVNLCKARHITANELLWRGTFSRYPCVLHGMHNNGSVHIQWMHNETQNTQVIPFVEESGI